MNKCMFCNESETKLISGRIGIFDGLWCANCLFNKISVLYLDDIKKESELKKGKDLLFNLTQISKVQQEYIKILEEEVQQSWKNVSDMKKNFDTLNEMYLEQMDKEYSKMLDDAEQQVLEENKKGRKIKHEKIN